MTIQNNFYGFELEGSVHQFKFKYNELTKSLTLIDLTKLLGLYVNVEVSNIKSFVMRNIVKHQIINSLLRTGKNYLALVKAKSLFSLYKEKHLL